MVSFSPLITSRPKLKRSKSIVRGPHFPSLTLPKVGLIYSIAAIGGLISSLLIPKIRKKLPRGKIFLYSILIDLIGMLLVTLSVNWWMMAFSFFIRTAGVTMSNIVYSTIRQEVTPNHLLGRVAGTSSLLIKLTMPLGFTSIRIMGRILTY